MTDDNFTQFDRLLEDIISDVARAHNTIHRAAFRYIAMIEAVDHALVLHYETMSAENKANFKAAMDKLIETAAAFL